MIGKFFRGIATVSQTMLIAAAIGFGIYFILILLEVISSYNSYGYYGYPQAYEIAACGVLLVTAVLDFFGMITLFVWTRKLATTIKITGESKHVELLRGFAKYMNACFWLGLVMLFYFVLMFIFGLALQTIFENYPSDWYIVQELFWQESLFAPAVVLGLVGFSKAVKHWKDMDDFLGTIEDSTVRQGAESGLKRVHAAHVVGFIASLCGIYFVIAPIISTNAQILNTYIIAVSTYGMVMQGLFVSDIVFICILAVIVTIGGIPMVTGYRKVGTAFQGIDEQAFDRVAGVAALAVSMHGHVPSELPGQLGSAQPTYAVSNPISSPSAEPGPNVQGSREAVIRGGAPRQTTMDVVLGALPGFCPECGYHLPQIPGVAYCPICGYKIFNLVQHSEQDVFRVEQPHD